MLFSTELSLVGGGFIVEVGFYFDRFLGLIEKLVGDLDILVFDGRIYIEYFNVVIER